MSSKIRGSTAARAPAILGAGFAAVLLSAAIPAQAQSVTPLRVDGSRPTSITVRVVGLAYPEVRREVRKTAQVVCHNAMRNGELYAFDLRWCANQASSKTLSHYRSALQSADASGDVRTALLTVGIVERN